MTPPVVTMTQAELDAMPRRPGCLTLGDVWRDSYNGVWYRVEAVMYSSGVGTTSARIEVVG